MRSKGEQFPQVSLRHQPDTQLGLDKCAPWSTWKGEGNWVQVCWGVSGVYKERGAVVWIKQCHLEVRVCRASTYCQCREGCVRRGLLFPYKTR